MKTHRKALLSYDHPKDPHHYGHLNWRAPLERFFDQTEVCEAPEVVDLLRGPEPVFLFECLNMQRVPTALLRERLEYASNGHLLLHFTTDDDWQFEIFSRFICQYYHVVTTNNPYRVKHYEAFGKSAIFVQYGCNSDVWRQLNLPKRYDVTLIGLPHSGRYQVVSHLRNHGVAVGVFGGGWDRYPELARAWGGYLSAEDVVRVTNESRICLNPLTASTGDQMAIKARMFEIAGCGSFQLCNAFDEVSRYYEVGKEIQVFHSLDDLVEKIRYYLAHADEREAIARAGYERTLREHTWDIRYEHMFREIERLRPQLAKTPQPIISQSRVQVLCLAREGHLANITAETLNSQTVPNLEVILVSEGEIPNAHALKRPWRKIREREVREHEPEAEFVAFIEDGDQWEPEKLQFQVFALEQDAPKGIEANVAQWGAGWGAGGDELATYVLRWLRDNHGHDDLVPRGVIPSALAVTARLFREERAALAGLLLEHDSSFAEKHFRDRGRYSHIELGVPLARVPESTLWRLIGSLRGDERRRWINSALRYRSAKYIPSLLRRLRLERAWTLWKAYRARTSVPPAHTREEAL